MQVGDMVICGNLIGIITVWSDDVVILKCHDGISHNTTKSKCSLLTSVTDIAAQYEEAIRKYGTESADKHW